MEAFIEKIEYLLEECKHEHMEEITFHSYGYMWLVELHDSGYTKDTVYQALYEKYLLYQDEDEFKSDLLADLMDFVVGYCSPCKKIWDNDGSFDRTWYRKYI